VTLGDAGSGEPFEHGRFELIEEAWPERERERAEAIVARSEEWLLEA
jgi:hypothetical protein